MRSAFIALAAAAALKQTIAAAQQQLKAVSY
jgi:hypothetical protein